MADIPDIPSIDDKDIALIRALQTQEAFLDLDPFGRIAETLGWTSGEVIERTRALKERGLIRRVGAAVTPANAGFNSNGMVVWDLADADADIAGKKLAEHERVSHCYLRKAFEGFPFTMYTMVHASTPEELEGIIKELSEASGLTQYHTFTTLKEFKKSSPIYFAENTGSEKVKA